MKVKEIKQLVTFSILMQNDEGILGKSPNYIEEKFLSSEAGGAILDARNQSILQEYMRRWRLDEQD